MGGHQGQLTLRRPLWSPPAAATLLVVGAALFAVYWTIDAWWLDAPPAVDVVVLEAFVRGRGEWTIAVSKALSRLGDARVVVGVGAALVIAARWRSGRWDAAFLAAGVVTGALALTALVKGSTDRARPDGALIDALSFAFPSGHASRAAAVYLLLGWLAWHLVRSRAARVGLVALAAAMAAATGVSRLLLGVHWPTDVLAGWLLGGLWTCAALLVARPRSSPRPAASEDPPGP